jgi:hypothetical protein
MLLQLVLNSFTVLESLRQGKSLFELFLLFSYEDIVGVFNVLVYLLIVGDVSKIEETLCKLLILEV